MSFVMTLAIFNSFDAVQRRAKKLQYIFDNDNGDGLFLWFKRQCIQSSFLFFFFSPYKEAFLQLIAYYTVMLAVSYLFVFLAKEEKEETI